MVDDVSRILSADLVDEADLVVDHPANGSTVRSI